MAILPLPQFEADLLADRQEREAYEKLKAPKTLVVRFGSMKMVGEFPWDSSEKPGCGSKIVVRTHRGVEIGEMLTSTCANNGCSKSVSRKEMLEYIENSGGRDYPFFTEGRALRVATKEDMDQQAKVEQSRHGLKLEVRAIADKAGIHVKFVDVEPILGGELLSVYYLSEERVDFRDLVPRLREHFGTRVELKQVGARDEARLTADYERCGQYCCCKNFLKVLKPISMKSAKIQKATLDPLKISGRCGRLMCCLRYEDETYESLRKNLPKKKQRVGTSEGDGIVIDSQILTQLVLVDLDEPDSTGKPRQVAVPVENLTPPVDPVGKPRAPMGAGPPPRSGPPMRPQGPGARRPDAAARNGPPRDGAPKEGPAADRPARPPSGQQPGPSADRPRDRAPDRNQDRGPDRSQDRGPDRARGPSRNARGGNVPQQPRADRAPRPPEHIDLDDIETDMGDRPAPQSRPRDGRGSGGRPQDNRGQRPQGPPRQSQPNAQPPRGPASGPASGPDGPIEPGASQGPDSESGPDGPRRRRRRRRGGHGRGPGGPGAGPNSGPDGAGGGPPPPQGP